MNYFEEQQLAIVQQRLKALTKLQDVQKGQVDLYKEWVDLLKSGVVSKKIIEYFEKEIMRLTVSINAREEDMRKIQNG